MSRRHPHLAVSTFVEKSSGNVVPLWDQPVDAVTHLLAAASAPARPEELQGEQAVREAYRSNVIDINYAMRRRRLRLVPTGIAAGSIAGVVVGSVSLVAAAVLTTPSAQAPRHQGTTQAIAGSGSLIQPTAGGSATSYTPSSIATSTGNGSNSSTGSTSATRQSSHNQHHATLTGSKNNAHHNTKHGSGSSSTGTQCNPSNPTSTTAPLQILVQLPGGLLPSTSTATANGTSASKTCNSSNKGTHTGRGGNRGNRHHHGTSSTSTGSNSSTSPGSTPGPSPDSTSTGSGSDSGTGSGSGPALSALVG